MRETAKALQAQARAVEQLAADLRSVASTAVLDAITRRARDLRQRGNDAGQAPPDNPWYSQEPMDMALCERHSLVLREGHLYRFWAVGDCKRCAALSRESRESYGLPPAHTFGPTPYVLPAGWLVVKDDISDAVARKAMGRLYREGPEAARGQAVNNAREFYRVAAALSSQSLPKRWQA